jgi:hypothetical protein
MSQRIQKRTVAKFKVVYGGFEKSLLRSSMTKKRSPLDLVVLNSGLAAANPDLPVINIRVLVNA